jgi:uncharacterized membrane protein YgdD (TMEM256/DUF423 family)
MRPGVWLAIGALSAALAVAMGAFGAHGLRGSTQASVSQGTLSEAERQRRLETFDTAARYQMYHALGLLVVGLLASSRPSLGVSIAGWAFVVGTLLFSGSLYALVLSGIKVLGAITPFGGAAMIVGWVALAVCVWKR